MAVWAIKQGACVNNFAYESAKINIEVKHLLDYIFPICHLNVRFCIQP